MSDLPIWLEEATELVYRSSALGIWGIVVRFVQMPLERIALVTNSSQVSGKGQLSQAWKIVWQDGLRGPWNVVTPRSAVAWFLQYGVMGFAFQTADRVASSLLGVDRLVYGAALFEKKDDEEEEETAAAASAAGAGVSAFYIARSCTKMVVAPALAGGFESFVSNKAEVERYLGRSEFQRLELLGKDGNAFKRIAGQAYVANTARNAIMSFSSFVATPFIFSKMCPEEHKTPKTLATWGIVGNFTANILGTATQSGWGRALDFLARDGRLNYKEMIREGYKQDGYKAFVNPIKWGTRVTANVIPQGMIPWYYNTIVPLAEPRVKQMVGNVYYSIFNR